MQVHTIKLKQDTTSIQIVVPVAVVGYTLYVQVQSIITQLLGKNPRDPSSNLVPHTYS